VRAQRSAARPRLDEGCEVARTRGAWRPAPGAGSNGEPRPWSTVESCGAVRKVASGWPTSRLQGLMWTSANWGAGRSLSRTCL
jgi:hypothetical protein